MQINGVREFLSRFTAQSGAANGRRNFAPSSFQPQKNVSDTGKRVDADRKSKEATKLLGASDPTNSLGYKYLSKAEQILERMYELAVVASDERLNDTGRVNMQIEMEDLRDQLAAMPRSLLREYGGRDPIKYLEIDENRRFGENNDSVLERMLTRITNGQEWDVREAYNPYGFTKDTDLNGDGAMDITERYSGGEWYIVGDEQYVYTRDGKSTGIKTPTVSERLKKETPFIVMDAASAAKAAESLKQKLQAVTDYRNDIIMGRRSDDYVYFFLDRIESFGGMLNNSDWRDVYVNPVLRSGGLREGGINNSSAIVVDGDRYETPFTEKDSAKDTGYVLDVLTEEEIAALFQNGEVEIFNLPRQPVVIDVPGVLGVYGDRVVLRPESFS